MNKLLLPSLLLAGMAGSSLAQAADGPWEIRFRAVYIKPADKSDPVGGAGVSDRITVSTKTIPEVDFSYFFTPNFATELILTYPQQHDVKLDGAKIGTFKHLPPTLTAQWHFLPGEAINPYLGAGLNLTLISDVSLAGGLGLNSSSVGPALQAGVDVQLAPQWFLNVDLKYVQIRSDVKTPAGAKVSAVKVDPLLVGVGVGYRF
jgi:outer membrane protein